MKSLLLSIAAITVTVVMGCQHTKVAEDTRDYAYEAYCDSIYHSDVDYYLDVIVESDEYCSYIEEHGAWWED